ERQGALGPRLTPRRPATKFRPPQLWQGVWSRGAPPVRESRARALSRFGYWLQWVGDVREADGTVGRCLRAADAARRADRGRRRCGAARGSRGVARGRCRLARGARFPRLGAREG